MKRLCLILKTAYVVFFLFLIAAAVYAATPIITSFSSAGGNPTYKDNDGDAAYKIKQGDVITFSITTDPAYLSPNYLWQVMQGSEVIVSLTESAAFSWTVPSATSTWEIEIEATQKDPVGNIAARESRSWSITTASLQIVNQGESIQAAIDSLPNEGGIVEIASGTWDITSTLQIIKSSVTLRGHGDDTIINTVSSSTDTLSAANVANISIQQLKLVGSGSDKDAINFTSVRNSIIKNITITNYSMGTPISLGLCNFVTITQNNIHDNGNGIFFNSCSDISITNNSLANITRGAAYAAIDSNANNRSKISNNTISHVTGPSSGISIYTSGDAQVNNNIIEYAAGGIWMYDIWNPTITCNVLRRNSYGIRIYHDYPTGEHGSKTYIRNNLIYSNSNEGIIITKSPREPYPLYNTIESNIIYDNGKDGISNLSFQHGVLKNNIIAGNGGYGINGHGISALYNDVYGNASGNYYDTPAGTGDISEDPLFANPASGDFHLKSRAGSWNGTAWTVDNVTSPCIDTGDPANGYSNEPQPNGGRINIGAYGNTSEASKSQSSIVTPPPDTTPPETAKGNSYVFPVPYVKGKSTSITFSNLIPPSQIEIYTVDGILVYEKEADARAYSFVPESFASGVYVYLIKNSKDTSTGKIVITK